MSSLPPYTMTPSAASLRIQIESALNQRIPGALTPRTRHSAGILPTGICSIDEMLNGGVPRGGLTEISGAASTGRTTLALSLLAQVTHTGACCAWVDVHDALDPESAAACGVSLEHLLWIRAGTLPADTKYPAQRQAVDHKQEYPKNTYNSSALHPRNETRGLDKAVSDLFRSENALKRENAIGTPGANSRVLFAPVCAEPQPHRRKQEQVAPDRLPPRRGKWILDREETRQQIYVKKSDQTIPAIRTGKPWPRLEQALKATDLLLQAGGFRLIVLDMSDTDARDVIRVPLASWYRFRLAAEQSQVSLVLLTQTPCARSCASLILNCDRIHDSEQWSCAGEEELLGSIDYRIAVERNRGEDDGEPLRKKPSGRAVTAWSTRAQWAR